MARWALGVLAAATAAAADPALARSDNFDVYAQGGTADARAIILEFERLHTYFAQQTGLRLDKHEPVRVIAFRSREEYGTYQLRPAADAYYVASDDRDTIVMTAPADGDIHVAAHEYAHFVLRANGLTLPPWLNEGLSEFFSTIRAEGRSGKLSIVPGHWRVLHSRAWMPLSELVMLPADSPLREQRESVEMFYAESWALADMLTVSGEYRPRFRDLVTALMANQPSDRALENIYGKSLGEIAADLRRWIEKRRITPVMLPDLDAEAVKTRVSAISLLAWRSVLANLLLITDKLDRAEAEYRELAREEPGNADFPAALGMVAVRRQDWPSARQQWRQALALGLADADICYRYALRGNAAGLPPMDIRPALERAVAVRPDFDSALYLLAQLDNNTGQYESAVAHLEAMHTVSAARQFAYWAALSYALDELGRHAEAKSAALEARDHATTAEERARALQLAEIADTDLDVRFARDVNGNQRLVTTRVPRNEKNWNPFIEPDDQIRRIDGKLRAVDCDGGKVRFVLATAAGIITLTAPDPGRVQMVNTTGEFTCGPQPGNGITAVYAAGTSHDGGSEGIVRGIEFH